ncbi:hypothetical protein [Commensalibacter papalotli (ex Botero et al. 2024)]|uniref:hypothetical protein n=1 Tax=Commensalibacter papalotli (ex Botero et al. 2024) TaxID=2972766 RepID=UPI0022FF7B5C|nr:hypothetical protein [Commensalibacter papalotli (ex Botero et al. 2024)]CAI3934985.1 unnamed protein product [Commensalibacter papalotli (ex Botero et al. 2024)]
MHWLKHSLYGLFLITPLFITNSYGQEMNVNSNSATLPGLSGQSANIHTQTPAYKGSGGGEHITVRGRRAPPPGYTYAPSMDMTKGPDPEHQRALSENKDAVSGANLSRYGTAYRESGPMGSGKLGDSTGNGWLTPR